MTTTTSPEIKVIRALASLPTSATEITVHGMREAAHVGLSVSRRVLENLARVGILQRVEQGVRISATGTPKYLLRKEQGLIQSPLSQAMDRFEPTGKYASYFRVGGFLPGHRPKIARTVEVLSETGFVHAAKFNRQDTTAVDLVAFLTPAGVELAKYVNSTHFQPRNRVASTCAAGI